MPQRLRSLAPGQLPSIYFDSKYASNFISRLLTKTKTFHFTSRKREDLPKGFPDDIPGVPHFLDDYIHPDVGQEQPLKRHIAAGMKEVTVQAKPSIKKRKWIAFLVQVLIKPGVFGLEYLYQNWSPENTSLPEKVIPKSSN